MLCVPALGIAGELGLFWNNAYDVQILQSCRNFIHAGIREKKSGNLLEATFVYGNPLFRQRRHLWQKLESLKPRNDGPWCLLGASILGLATQEKGLLQDKKLTGF